MSISITSTMIDGTFQVSWGALQGGVAGNKYVEVIRAEQGWLYVQPITEYGEDDGEPMWIGPGAITAMWPFAPKKKPRRK